jgi:DNA polymerase-3 subunit epsilon
MSRIVVIDTETTGLDYLGGHRVIEIAAIEIVDGVISRDKYFQSYLNPEGKKSAPKALKVHGLETEFLASHPKFKDIAEPFLDFYLARNSLRIIENLILVLFKRNWIELK